MPEYGEIRVDYITYTTGTSPNEGQGTVTVSGLINNPTFSGNVIVGNDLTVSGTLNANGMTVTGDVIVSGTMSGESMTLSTGIFASGTESAPSITFIDDLNTGIYSPAEDALGIVTDSTERLSINSSGNVGIGTNDPFGRLNVSGIGAAPSLTYDTDNLVNIDQGGVQLAIGVDPAGPFGAYLQGRDSNNNARSILLNPVNGNVGIGTTSPGQRLQVSDTSGATISIKAAGNNTGPRVPRLIYSFDDGDGAAINATRATSDTAADVNLSFRTGGITNAQERMRILPNGNVGIGTTNPGALLTLEESQPTDGILLKLNNDTNTSGSEAGLRITHNNTSQLECNILTERGGLNAGLDFKIELADSVGTVQERMRITEDGNVGIGTSSPNELLCVGSSSSADQRISLFSQAVADNESYGSILFNYNSPSGNKNAKITALRKTSSSGADLAFYTRTSGDSVNTDGGEERLRISSIGNVGIGTTNPPQKLTVSQSANINSGNVSGAARGTLSLQNIGGTPGAENLGCGIIFSGIDTSRRRALIASYQDGADGDPTGLSFYTYSSTTSASEAVGERMRITSGGNVGIGTTAPKCKLTTYFSGTTPYATSLPATSGIENGTEIVAYRNTSTSTPSDFKYLLQAFSIQGGTSQSNVFGRFGFARTSNSQGAFVWQIRNLNGAGIDNSQEAMRLTNDGRLNIGTTDDISVNTGTNDGITIYQPGTNAGIMQMSNNNACLFLRRRDTDGAIAQFRRDTTLVGSISVTTTATAYNTSSDYRLKENVVPLTNAANRVNQLQVHRFNFIGDPDTTVDGFLAHEAQAVVPECVTGTKDEVDDEGNPVYQGIDKSKIVPLLTAALQEALAKIETLEQRLNDAGL